MNFFKRLFSSNKEEISNEQKGEHKMNFNEVFTNDYFNERYSEENIKPSALEGCLKMVEGYFIDNKIERKIKSPINHPLNLDQTIDDGFGFDLYCKAFNLSDGEAALFLALAFGDYLITNYGFKLYKDSQPEYPLRGMTLKYDKDGVLLSLYPFEYASKALSYQATFEELYEKIESQLKKMPKVDDLLKDFTGRIEE